MWTEWVHRKILLPELLPILYDRPKGYFCTVQSVLIFPDINLDTVAENPKSLRQEHCQNVGFSSAHDKPFKSMPVKPRRHHRVTFLQSVCRKNEYHL